MRCVVAAYGSRGDVEPCVAVATELRRRGHDVTMALTVPQELRSYFASQNLTAVPYGRDLQELLQDNDFIAMLQNPIGSITQALDYVAQVTTEKNSTLMSVAAGADLIVAGMTEQEAAAAVADHHRIPLAALHFFPSQILQTGPPAAQADHAGAQRRPLEIQAYDDICLPGPAETWSADGRRPFVGALTIQLPTDHDDEVLSWIGAAVPPVYFGFGSTPIADPAGTVLAIAAACARIGARALINLGHHDVAGIEHPDHVAVVSAVNHAAVFPACRAVVHHGGAGTTAAGLRAGVPTLILWNGLDQPMWATGVANLGVGLGRRFSETTPESLAADLTSLFASPCAARARDLAKRMTPPAESLTRTVDLIEATANRVS